MCQIEDATTMAVTETIDVDKLRLRVLFSSNIIPVKHGERIELNCTVYGGDSNTDVVWMQDNLELVKSVKSKKIIGKQIILNSRITVNNPNILASYICVAKNQDLSTATAVLTMQQHNENVKDKISLTPMKSECKIMLNIQN